jgi:Maltooligosyl trehalose synthase
MIMAGALASDLNLLAHALTRIAEADRNTRDLTFNVLRRTVMLYTAALPVYRTYIDSAVPERRTCATSTGRSASPGNGVRRPTGSPSIFSAGC